MEQNIDKTGQIADVLRQELADGIYPAGGRFPSEYDLAERFQVHKSTANKAVSMLAAEGLLVRGGRGAGTRVLRQMKFPRGILGFVGSLNHPYPTAVLRGMQKMALAHGFLTTVFAPSPEEEADCLKLLPESSLAGVVICRNGLLLKNDSLPVIHVDSDLLQYLIDFLFLQSNQYYCNCFQKGIL